MAAPLTALLLWTLMVCSSFMVVSADQEPITAEPGDNVTLPCRAPKNKDITVVEWSRTDLKSDQYVLAYRDGNFVVAQCPSFRNRTNLLDVENGDVSLVLKNVTTDDTGTYECRVVQEGTENISIINLRVEPDRKIITAEHGENVILPCRDPENDRDGDVEWRRTDLEFSQYVIRYKDKKFDQEVQSPSYRNRTNLQDMKNGDVSLVLKKVTTADTGTYECRVIQRENSCRRTSIRDTDPPISIINLRVEPASLWSTVLLVLLGLLGLLSLVLIVAGLLHHFGLCFKSEYYVVVDSEEESVLLPCRTRPLLPGDARVEWRDSDGDVVHVYQNGSDQTEEQDWFYRNRTKMKRNLLRTGDLSLTLEQLTDEDTDIYTCIVSRGKENILMKKEVHLKVKVPKVKVDSRENSVLLPCRATVTLAGDARVEWRDKRGWKVHVYENGSDHPGEQNQFYNNRTKMNEDLLRTGDLSLTLEHPTDEDTDIYTCIVSRGKENILMKKQVFLRVKVHQVEVKEGAESVLLPFTTKPGLPEGARVVWMDKEDRKVHVYMKDSDHPEEQDLHYRNRTKMNEVPLRTGDLSLTLMSPTTEDRGYYRCGVWKDDTPLRGKTFYLTVKGGRPNSAPSSPLPSAKMFGPNSTLNLRFVSIRSARSFPSHKTHVISNTLVQNQPEDTRTRTSSTDPTPLMADESV